MAIYSFKISSYATLPLHWLQTLYYIWVIQFLSHLFFLFQWVKQAILINLNSQWTYLETTIEHLLALSTCFSVIELEFSHRVRKRKYVLTCKNNTDLWLLQTTLDLSGSPDTRLELPRGWWNVKPSEFLSSELLLSEAKSHLCSNWFRCRLQYSLYSIHHYSSCNSD